jgi:hypothetical protein
MFKDEMKSYRLHANARVIKVCFNPWCRILMMMERLTNCYHINFAYIEVSLFLHMRFCMIFFYKKRLMKIVLLLVVIFFVENE